MYLVELYTPALGTTTKLGDSLSHGSGCALTGKTGPADNAFGEAAQIEGVRDIVDHEGNVQGPHPRAHPALLGLVEAETTQQQR